MFRSRFIGMFLVGLTLISCGKLNDSKSGKSSTELLNAKGIFKGTLDTTNKYPGVVLIASILEGDKVSTCSGSVIHDRIILTAAHCLVGAKEVYVRKSKNQWISVDKAKVHPQYSGPNTPDLAVLHLTESSGVAPLRYNVGLLGLSTTYSIVGFGAFASTFDADKKFIGNNIDYERRFGTVKVTAVTDMSKPSYYKAFIKAIPTAAKQIACQGDSGGPLLRSGQIVGVFSRLTGQPTGDGNIICSTVKETLYIGVRPFSTFISNAMKDLLNVPPPPAPVCEEYSLVGSVTAGWYSERTQTQLLPPTAELMNYWDAKRYCERITVPSKVGAPWYLTTNIVGFEVGPEGKAKVIRTTSVWNDNPNILRPAICASAHPGPTQCGL